MSWGIEGVCRPRGHVGESNEELVLLSDAIKHVLFGILARQRKIVPLLHKSHDPLHAHLAIVPRAVLFWGTAVEAAHWSIDLRHSPHTQKKQLRNKRGCRNEVAAALQHHSGVLLQMHLANRVGAHSNLTQEAWQSPYYLDIAGRSSDVALPPVLAYLAALGVRAPVMYSIAVALPDLFNLRVNQILRW